MGCQRYEVASSSLTVMLMEGSKDLRQGQHVKVISHGDTEYGYNFKMTHKVENMAVVFLGRVTEGEAVNAQHGGHSRVANDTTLAYENSQAPESQSASLISFSFKKQRLSQPHLSLHP